MKAVVVEKPGVVELRDVEKPKAAEGFALIKVKACAICATDLEVISAGIPAAYPIIMGHEWSGVVEDVGSESDRQWVGKRVVGSNDICCLKCSYCHSGQWRYCSDFREIGFKANGAYAEYVAVPAYGLCELPESISFAQGALIEPLGVAVGTLTKANAKLGDSLVIIGAGSIGLHILAVAKAMGMRKIIVADQNINRLEIARKMGAYAVIATNEQHFKYEIIKIHPNGVDVAVDATGAEECVKQCISVTKPGGYMALVGYAGGRNVTLRIDDIHVNNIHMVGAGNNWSVLNRLVTLFEEKIVDTSPLITHRIKLEDFEEGIRLAKERPTGFVKVIFEP